MGSRRASLTVDAITGHGCFKSGSPIDLTSHRASAGPHCRVIMPGINRALGWWHYTTSHWYNGQCGIHLFLPNPSSQPLLTRYIFHSFHRCPPPTPPYGFQTIIVSVLLCVLLYLSPCCPCPANAPSRTSCLRKTQLQQGEIKLKALHTM